MTMGEGGEPLVASRLLRFLSLSLIPATAGATGFSPFSDLSGNTILSPEESLVPPRLRRLRLRERLRE